MVNTILLALAPIFFVLALGYGAGRLRMVDNQHVDSLNALVMNFALPASLFAATASAPRSELFAQAPLFLILGAVMLVMFLAWYFLQVRLGNAGKADASLQGLTIAFPNLAGVGLPILADVLGPSGTVPLAVALASGSIIVSPLSLIVVELSRKQDGVAEAPTARILRSLRRALTKPVVLAPALGILFSLCGFKTRRRRRGLPAADRARRSRRGAVPDRPDPVGPIIPVGLDGCRRDCRGQHHPAAAHGHGRLRPAGRLQRPPRSPFCWPPCRRGFSASCSP